MTRLALAAAAAATILCSGLSANWAEAMPAGGTAGIPLAIQEINSVETAGGYYYHRYYHRHRHCRCWWSYHHRHCRCWRRWY
jgi:hypothetical protein